jgi:hypothetical protein
MVKHRSPDGILNLIFNGIFSSYHREHREEKRPILLRMVEQERIGRKHF